MASQNSTGILAGKLPYSENDRPRGPGPLGRDPKMRVHNPISKKFKLSCDRLREFLACHKRLPTLSALDDGERKLFQFVRQCRHYHLSGSLSDERREVIVDIEPGILAPTLHYSKIDGRRPHNPISKEFKLNCDRLREFIAFHKRLPTLSALDDGERKLYQFTRHCRHSHNSGTLSNERREVIVDIDPGILAPTVHCSKIDGRRPPGISVRFKFNCDRLRNFIACHKRLPSCSAEDDGEKSLHHFIKSCRNCHSYGSLSNERREVIVDIHPGILAPSLHCSKIDAQRPPPISVRFKLNCDRLRNFLACHKRLPSYSAEDDGEKRLYRFIASCRHYLGSTLSNERREAIDAINPGLLAPKLRYEPNCEQSHGSPRILDPLATGVSGGDLKDLALPPSAAGPAAKSSECPAVSTARKKRKKIIWQCDICKVARFDNYGECLAHEKECTNGGAQKAPTEGGIEAACDNTQAQINVFLRGRRNPATKPEWLDEKHTREKITGAQSAERDGIPNAVTTELEGVSVSACGETQVQIDAFLRNRCNLRNKPAYS